MEFYLHASTVWSLRHWVDALCVCVCVSSEVMVFRILAVCLPCGSWQQVRSDYKLSITSTHISAHALPFFSPNVINLYPHAFACLQHQFENKVEREELERKQSHRGRKKSPYRKSIISSHLPLLPGWCSWGIIFSIYREKSAKLTTQLQPGLGYVLAKHERTGGGEE